LLHLARPPGLPFALRFVGRAEGQEEVHWFDGVWGDTLIVPLGTVVFMAIHGLPLSGIPAYLQRPPKDLRPLRQVLSVWPWMAVHRDPARRRRSRILPRYDLAQSRVRVERLMAVYAPFADRIQARVVTATRGASLARLRELKQRVGDARIAAARAGTPESVRPAESAYLNYQADHLEFPLLWYAADLEALAWCEVRHALLTHAPARDCATCGLRYIRAKARIGRHCPLCRCLTKRQRARIRRSPAAARPARAREFYITTKLVIPQAPTVSPELMQAVFAPLSVPVARRDGENG
jgi:hypothetical protein